MKLNRKFNSLALTLILINGTIGSAWLFAPLYASRIAGPLALISWVLAGLAILLIALNYTELTTLLPIAGGSARYPQLTHGEFTNFIMAWFVWLSSVTAPPLEAQAAVQYAAAYFPQLVTPSNLHQLSWLGVLCAASLACILSLINIRSYQTLNRANGLIFLFKVGVIVAAIFFIIKTSFFAQNFAHYGNQLAESGLKPIFSAVAMGGLIYALSGFKIITELAGEAKDPTQTIPISLISAIVISLLLYLGLQVAFLGAIDPASLKGNWHLLTFSAEAGPLVGLATILGLTLLVKFLYVDAIVSPLGAGLVTTTKAARLVYGMSKNGDFPSIFSRLNSHGFPHYAIGFNFIISIFLLLLFRGWQQLMSFLSSAAVIGYMMGPVALLCLRMQLGKISRPFKIWAAHFTSAVTFYICNLMVFWMGWQTVYEIGIAATIAFLYLLVRYRSARINKTRFNIKSIFWLGPHLLGLVVLSYLGSFRNGLNVIPFGWDFIVIGVFSILMLALAIWTRLRHVDEQYLLYVKELTEAEKSCCPKPALDDCKV